MRARESQQAPRPSGARSLAGFRIWAGKFRRVFPSIAVAFLVFLPALGFGGSHFAQLLLNSARGPVEPPAAGETIGLRVDDGPDGVEFALRARLQSLEAGRARVCRIEISSDPGTDRTYAAADEVRVTVTFSRRVQVAGSPHIELSVGREVKRAFYQSGAGSPELVFTSRVAEGDEDSDGVSIDAGSLILDKGAISDLSGLAALPDHVGLEADPRHRVDAVRPVLLEEKAELDGDQLTLPFAERLDVASTPGVLERIRELGGRVLSSVERYRAVRAEIPLSEVEALAAHEAVRTIRTADKAMTRNRRRKPSPDVLVDILNAGSRTTQGDVAHRANTARTTHGVDGTGIGVLSDGVDSLAQRQATRDLPARVTVLEHRYGEGNEGTAMLEIVHDLAPGASSRSESTTSRSGTYTYEKAGASMGAITLNYDDGATCRIRLSFTEAGVGAFAYDKDHGVFGGEPVSGLRGGQRRRGSGRAQRRRSLPAREGVVHS